MSTSVQGLIQKAYDSLKASDAAAAAKLLEEALAIDFEHPEVIHALKCLNWWLDKIKRLPEFHNPYDRGGFILSQWKSYYIFLDRIGEDFDPCQYALRRFVFSTALQSFQDVLGDGVNQHDPGILLQVGRCYKGAGNYELSLKYLEQAIRFKREDGETLSELADVYALLEETKAAKVLFREAFFLDPQGIDLRSMESEMIKRLRDWVRELGYEGSVLAEWLPIYGCLLGVFSVKRELKPVELTRLKQSIFTLETEIRNNPFQEDLLKPRLINRYFWLIDHYENTREDPSQVEETMLKIKVIDPVIYERYRN
ncbi:MAG: tetratricopeptide repeat protein [Treponema sp.]|jgi:tetratricopeptide (TPR) repeat protein|nr:tetratricopeptide repeat protein [Treponema sp.]